MRPSFAGFGFAARFPPLASIPSGVGQPEWGRKSYKKKRIRCKRTLRPFYLCKKPRKGFDSTMKSLQDFFSFSLLSPPSLFTPFGVRLQFPPRLVKIKLKKKKRPRQRRSLFNLLIVGSTAKNHVRNGHKGRSQTNLTGSSAVILDSGSCLLTSADVFIWAFFIRCASAQLNPGSSVAPGARPSTPCFGRLLLLSLLCLQ